MGIRDFRVLWLNERTEAKCAVHLDATTLKRRLPSYLEHNNASDESLIIRFDAATLIQVDDCDAATLARLEPFAFLTERTSPGAYQAWISVTAASLRDSIRERLLAHLAPTGANGGLLGVLATRWPGSLNRKPIRRGPDGRAPRVELLTVAPGRHVTKRQLEQALLLAPVSRPIWPGWTKHLGLRLLHGGGAPRLADWYHGQSVSILSYGGITAGRALAAPDHSHVWLPRDQFVAHLDYLQRRYQILRLVDVVDALREHRALPPHSLVLTFEHGFRNVLTVVAPLLVERHIPATVFIVPERVHDESRCPLTGDGDLSNDETHLSWQEIRLLRERAGIDSGMLLPSLSWSSTLSVDDLATWLEQGFTLFREHTGVAAPPLACPYGEYRREIADRAQQLGFSCVLACGDKGRNPHDANRYALRCTLITSSDHAWLPALATHVAGLESWWWRWRGRQVVEG